MSDSTAHRVRELSIEDELGQSFGRYAEKVILDRAIPDIRDGLKPVQRRIIFAMGQGGNTPDKPYRKAATTVGNVMGKYHPHGDSAIYDALVRLAQPWKMRYPLIDGHGNFGSMDDDPAAAMRYTEARLSPIAMELLADLDKDTVPWRPNFDDKHQEPVVLPAGYLNLLVNGSAGVSAGFATNIPSHNLVEVTNAALALLKNPDTTLEALRKHLLGPDFPTGGILMGAEGLDEAYETGRGKVVLRARHTVEKQRDGKFLLIYSELPYNIVKSDLVRQLDQLRLDREVHGVSDVRDESGRDGLRVVVEVAKDADPDMVAAFLFKKTNLQINYHFNVVTICRNTPMQVGLKAVLRAFVEHRREVVRRRTRYELDRAQTRLHQVEGLIVAVDMLDEVIAAIRASQDRKEARERLIAMKFSEPQAEAILELRLARLTNLQIVQLKAEQAALLKDIAIWEGILADPKVCDKVVSTDLRRIRDKYGDDRRTSIEAEVERLEVSLEVTVKSQEVVVGVTRQGWIKRVSMASFQASGGDRKSCGVRPGDRMHYVLPSNTRHNLLVFSASGQCYPIGVHNIPEAKWADVGTALVNVCGIEKDDAVAAVIDRADFPDDEHLLLVTRGGMVKTTALADFHSTRSSGFGAIKLSDGDKLATVLPADREGEVLLMTKLGQGIRFLTDQISVQGRSAKGVRGMKVRAENDHIVSVVQVAQNQDTIVATFTASGRAKLTPLEQYPRQNRGGKGVRMIINRVNPHTCVALLACGMNDVFEVVDTLGTEHDIIAERIPVTRRDGNAWNLVPLKDGAQVTLVEVFTPPPQDPPPGG